MFNEDVEEGRNKPDKDNYESCGSTACWAKGSSEYDEFDEDEDREE